MRAETRYKRKLKLLQDTSDQAGVLYEEAVQELVDKHQVMLATGIMSDFWQVSTDGGKSWQCETYTPRDASKLDEGEEPDPPRHPILDDLQRLDKLGEDFGFGPSNMAMYKPRPRSK